MSSLQVTVVRVASTIKMQVCLASQRKPRSLPAKPYVRRGTRRSSA